MSTLEEQQQQLPLLINQLVEKGIMTEEEGDALLNTILSSNLPLGEMNKLFSNLANEAGLPVVTGTKDKVARWRKIIINLMLAGITGAILENGIPGIYYTLYEKISTTVMLLLNSGIPRDQIHAFVNNPPAVSFPSMTDTSETLLNLKDTLINGFFIASSILVSCINVVCSTAQKIYEQLSIDNFKFITKLTAQMATPSGIAYAFQILKGSYDNEIARFIDSGSIQRALSEADDTVIDVKRSIGGAVAVSAIDINDMSLGIKWTNLVPDRRMEPSTDTSINNEIERAISDIFSNPNNSEKFSKIEMLNDILEVLREQDKPRAIQKFTAKYRDTGSDRIPILLTLLTAPSSKKSDYESLSQPDPISYAIPGDDFKMRRTNSFMGSFNPEFSGSKSVLNQSKANLTRFDAAIDKPILENIGILPSKTKVKKITWNKQNDRFLYEFINVWLNDNYRDLVQKLNFLSPENHNVIIERIRQMALDGRGYDLVSSIDDPNKKDRSFKELIELFQKIYESIKVQMDTYPSIVEEELAGGRRRYKKSRHSKKRRATLKRRRVKGIKTRKGKKRISTKRKR